MSGEELNVRTWSSEKRSGDVSRGGVCCHPVGTPTPLLPFPALLCVGVGGGESNDLCKLHFPTFLANWLLEKFDQWKALAEDVKVRRKGKPEYFALSLLWVPSVPKMNLLCGLNFH